MCESDINILSHYIRPEWAWQLLSFFHPFCSLVPVPNAHSPRLSGGPAVVAGHPREVYGSALLCPEWGTAGVRDGGSIDFVLPMKGWALELTREGGKSKEHYDRFQSGGNYWKWIDSDIADRHPEQSLYRILVHRPSSKDIQAPQ